MAKFASFLVFMAVSIYVQGVPISSYDELVAAAEAGDWDKTQALLAKSFADSGWKEVSLGNVRELKPPKGGHVYGESKYTFHSSSDINGQKSEKNGGHQIVNNDGKVKEFDFKPLGGQEDFQKEFFKKFGIAQS